MEELRRCAVQLLLIKISSPGGRTEADVIDVAKTLVCWTRKNPLNSMAMGPLEGKSETSLSDGWSCSKIFVRWEGRYVLEDKIVL
jgi:hypothetical protein